MLLVSSFNYKGKTVMVTPMQVFYISANKGKNEIRIAYVLNTSELKEAMGILRRGLEAYLNINRS